MFQAKKLVVLGSVNADHILMVDDFPRPGETVTGHGYRVLPGGKGANQAVAAARLGANMAFIACVGDDDFGRRQIKAYQSDGMDIRAVMTIKDMPTGIALISIAASGENSIAISPEANACLTPERIKAHRELLRNADTLLMQLESPLETIELAAGEAKAVGAQVILNPAPARELPDSLLSNLTMITPNETEAELLTGIKVEDEKDAAKAAQVFHGKGIPTVIITLGARGAFISAPDGARLVPGFRVQAVDTTAAGDTFNGALAAAMQEGRTTDEAIRFAHAAAALSVTRIGAQPSIPGRAEVDEFLKQNA